LSQAKPEYEPVTEFKDIATKIIQKYPELLDGVNPNLISCVAVTNKEQKEGKSKFELKPVIYPFRLDCPFDYYLVINASVWETLDEAHKAALICDALCSVDREQPGKVVPFDLKAHAVMIRTLGPDFMERGKIPNILTDNIDWKKEPQID
jgi:hypothetical protein